MKARLVSETINFERKVDPKTSMRLGSSRIPRKGEKFSSFYGPKTGWVEVIALDDPTYHDEITYNGEILSPSWYECQVEIIEENSKKGIVTVAQYWTKDELPEFSNKWWLSNTENYTYRELKKISILALLLQ